MRYDASPCGSGVPYAEVRDWFNAIRRAEVHPRRMPNYRRVRVPGGTYFLTVGLLERDRRLLVEHIEALRAAFSEARAVRPFSVVAAVVLPDHLRCVWRLPPGMPITPRGGATSSRRSHGRFPRQSVAPCSTSPGRTRDLAAKVLGAPDPRRT
jgi:hypothetical protein